MDEPEEDEIEFVVAGGDPAEVLEPPEEAVDLIASTVEFTVVGPCPVAVAGQRNNRELAQVPGQLAMLVAVIGAVHDQRRASDGRAEAAHQFATTGCVAGLTR